MITDVALGRILRQRWGLPEETQVARHDGGMGSRTWIVDCAGRRWVAKAVAPHLADQFAKGLQVASLLERAGIQSGAPSPTDSGSFTADTRDGCRIALLTWVPGIPLTGTGERQQRLMGATLARVHTALQGRSVTGAQRFHWVTPAASHLGLRSWLRPAVAAAVDALTDSERRPPVRPSGLLHADPAPGAFRYDPARDRCGVIDWGSAVFGPLLYDVASCVMYLGGTGNAGPMLDAYCAAGPLTAAEIADGLPVMLRFRWAVQADYFARRIADNDLTGIFGPAENEKGLEDARRALLASIV